MLWPGSPVQFDLQISVRPRWIMKGSSRVRTDDLDRGRIAWARQHNQADWPHKDESVSHLHALKLCQRRINHALINLLRLLAIGLLILLLQWLIQVSALAEHVEPWQPCLPQ